ncbi:GDSL-type esterase/lipase family protein [Tianweitania sp.]|uniref:GDSL-type esterase/lipase family protein n=1 Tax=Tianweitania sp. TaxID=2021634 RepID=UPI00289B88C0|nr:GDSL-type esterase/lipase family protein [Tianweitania sp.]
MYDFPPTLGTNRHENDIYAILAQLERNGVPRAPIAFYGSSSIRLWTGLTGDLKSLDVVNLGFGGGTFLSGIHYMERLLLPLNPTKIVLYFGENDIANDGLTARSTFSNFLILREQISERLPTARVFILSTKQSPARWLYSDEVDRFNTLCADWCSSRTDTCWIDVGTGLLGENGRPMSRLFLPDLIHMNPAGYAIWAHVLKSSPGLLDRLP